MAKNKIAPIAFNCSAYDILNGAKYIYEGTLGDLATEIAACDNAHRKAALRINHRTASQIQRVLDALEIDALSENVVDRVLFLLSQNAETRPIAEKFREVMGSKLVDLKLSETDRQHWMRVRARRQNSNGTSSLMKGGSDEFEKEYEQGANNPKQASYVVARDKYETEPEPQMVKFDSIQPVSFDQASDEESHIRPVEKPKETSTDGTKSQKSYEEIRKELKARGFTGF